MSNRYGYCEDSDPVAAVNYLNYLILRQNYGMVGTVGRDKVTTVVIFLGYSDILPYATSNIFV